MGLSKGVTFQKGDVKRWQGMPGWYSSEQLQIHHSALLPPTIHIPIRTISLSLASTSLKIGNRAGHAHK